MVRELAGTVYRRFFMKLDDVTSDKLLLNKDFVNDCFAKREGGVFFMPDDADAWEFIIKVEEGCVYLTGGWSTFCSAYILEKDDHVLLSYDMDNTFVVRFFKKNGLEKDVSYVPSDLDDFEAEDWSDDILDENEGGDDLVWSSDFSLELTPDRLLQLDDEFAEKLPQAGEDVMEETKPVDVVQSDGFGESMFPCEGSPMCTPVQATGEPSSAKGSVTSKKRAAAKRFKGLVVGERLNFLAAIEAERQVVETVVQMNEDTVNVSSGTVATHLGQLVGEPVFKKRKEELNGDNAVKYDLQNRGFRGGSNGCVVIQCAQAEQRFIGYCAVKMTASILRRKYRVPLDLLFGRSNLDRGQNDVVVRTEDGLVWAIGCYLGMKRARINNGWRKFSKDNASQVGDLVVLVHGKNASGSWDVVIFRDGA